LPASAGLRVAAGPGCSVRGRPPPLARWVHPLVSSSSPSEFSDPYPPDTSRRRAPPLGFGSPSRHQSTESTRASVPSSLRSALGVSHPLDGFLLDRPRGFVSPRNHVRASLYRGFPPPQPRHLVGDRCPLVVRRCPREDTAPPSGPCSASESVALARGFSPRTARSPLELPLLRDLLPAAPPASRRTFAPGLGPRPRSAFPA
jgi:hypothetical protein